MRTLNYLLLPVRNPRQSATLYTRLLGCEPVEDSESFVLYVLPTGLKLGLWAASEMEPKPASAGGIDRFHRDEPRRRTRDLRGMAGARAKGAAEAHRHGLRLHLRDGGP
jgi:catechol 2,3-dioxygenase-like lactoylglutathione lyase family enzyme